MLALGNPLHWLLYDMQSNPACGDPPDYELDVSGMLLFAGRPIGWTSDDLMSTGHSGHILFAPEPM